MSVATHLVRLSIEGFEYNMFIIKALDSAALHASKDFAVSPGVFPYRLFPKEPVCFRSRRHCSHLYVIADTTGITRYLAPYCYGRVRTFLPTKSEAIIMPQHYNTVL